jgi:hypothetical protein
MKDQPEFEELEHIPWSALAARAPIPLARYGLVAVVTVAVIGLGLAALNWIQSDNGAVPTTPPATPTAPLEDVDPVGEGTPETEMVVLPQPTTAAATVSVASIYSEADLMAIAVEPETRLAVMEAEWFVQDYFTVDGDEQASELLTEILGDVALPHNQPSGPSYVEWARAFAVASPAPGRYVVDVAFRTLAAPPGGEFTRMPVRGVAMTFDIDLDGTAKIVDLPSPTALPAVAAMSEPVGTSATAPEEVITAALRFVKAAGEQPEITDVSQDGSSWRFVIEVTDVSGNRWPMAVVVNDS